MSVSQSRTAPRRGRPSRSATFLFWVMFLSGGASLSACLLLPVWLEYRALCVAQTDTRARIAEMEQRLTSYEHQIDHLLNDPAYLERLARQEFGLGANAENVIFVSATASAPAESRPAPDSPTEDRWEVIGREIEQAATANPLVSLFVRDETRPIVMGMSALVIVTAIVTLNWRRPRDPTGS